MPPIARASLLFALAFGYDALAQPPRPPPIRPVTQCIDPDHVRGWRMLDTHSIVVVEGDRHYIVTTRVRCGALARTMGLRLSTHSYGRVCGDTGEVIEIDGTRCPIDRVQLLSNEEYEELRRSHAQDANPKTRSVRARDEAH
jgi:hypothetical protein